MKLPGFMVNEMRCAGDVAHFSNGSPCLSDQSKVSFFKNDNQLCLDFVVLHFEQLVQLLTASDGASLILSLTHHPLFIAFTKPQG
jgi:hypothetical protein